METTPSGRGAEGIWKLIALMLLSFLTCAVFLGLPAGAQLTGEYALRIELAAAKDELKRLRAEHDRAIRDTKKKLDRIEKIASDLDWMVKWVQAAGRK